MSGPWYVEFGVPLAVGLVVLAVIVFTVVVRRHSDPGDPSKYWRRRR